MTSSSPELKIARIQGSLSTCTPNLMPFHIAYCGPAPISTYFRVKPAPEPTYGKEKTPQISPSTSEDSTPPAGDTQTQTAGSSQTTLVASSSTASILPMSEVSLDTAVDCEMEEGRDAVVNTTGRFEAAFRGRTVQGLTVDLPTGYTGIVLRTPDEGKDKQADSSRNAELARENVRPKGKKAGKRGTRRSARAMELEVEEDGDAAYGYLDGQNLSENETMSRVLQPTSMFSSFVLWNPDIPVDEGKDEYLRSLTEWTRLAAEIHHCED